MTSAISVYNCNDQSCLLHIFLCSSNIDLSNFHLYSVKIILFCFYFPARSWIVIFFFLSLSLSLSRSLLVRQLVEPVNWSKTIQNISKGRTRNNKLYEVGPGKQLRAMIYRIDRTLLDNFTNLEP